MHSAKQRLAMVKGCLCCSLQDLLHNRDMPKISAGTIAEHREARRDGLLAAAAQLMQEGKTFTVAQVAQEVGLSRSAVYEYYGSAADLIADVLVDEMALWVDEITPAVNAIAEPMGRIAAWVTGVLEYVEQGRHALVKSAGSVDLPPARRAQVQGMHRELIAPLSEALTELSVLDVRQMSSFIWGVTDAAIKRIENQGAKALAEADAVMAFIDHGLIRP
jgi:AcrR family transcriptional regulator